MKNLLIVDNEIYSKYINSIGCREGVEIYEYLLQELLYRNLDIWSNEYIKNIKKEDIDIFNTSNCIYPNETVQRLLFSNEKIKIDLVLNMINSLYK